MLFRDILYHLVLADSSNIDKCSDTAIFIRKTEWQRIVRAIFEIKFKRVLCESVKGCFICRIQIVFFAKRKGVFCRFHRCFYFLRNIYRSSCLLGLYSGSFLSSLRTSSMTFRCNAINSFTDGRSSYSFTASIGGSAIVRSHPSNRDHVGDFRCQYLCHVFFTGSPKLLAGLDL